MRHHHKSKIYVADIVFILFKVKEFFFSYFILTCLNSEILSSHFKHKLLEKPLYGTLNYIMKDDSLCFAITEKNCVIRLEESFDKYREKKIENFLINFYNKNIFFSKIYLKVNLKTFLLLGKIKNL